MCVYITSVEYIFSYLTQSYLYSAKLQQELSQGTLYCKVNDTEKKTLQSYDPL